MDDIFGDRFYGTRFPAWHGLGKVFFDDPDTSEAFRRIGLDYEVHLQPSFIEWNGQRVETGKYGLLRPPTADDPHPRVFGETGRNYEIVQNMEIAQALDPLTRLWPVETAGALGKGETIFVTLKAGAFDVQGDPVENYFLVTDTKDGGTSLTIAVTPVRVVCRNTLIMGLSQATIRSAIRHQTGVRDELEWRTQLIEQMQRHVLFVSDLFGEMAQVRLTRQDFQDVLTACYPEPILPPEPVVAGTSNYELRLLSSFAAAQNRYEQERELWAMKQAGAEMCYARFGDENPKVAETAWAAYNAVVEVEDYRKGRGDQALASALFGERALIKRKAFRTACDMGGLFID